MNIYEANKEGKHSVKKIKSMGKEESIKENGVVACGN